MSEKILVGGSARGGKTLAQIQYLIKLVKRLDCRSKKNIATIKYYDELLQKLSGGSIGVQFWMDWDNTLKCKVIYPNSAVREMLEYCYFGGRYY